MDARPNEARRALVLHDRPLVVDLIELTLNHGLFVVRAARSLAEAEAILDEWRPHMTVVDMDHDDSTALLQRIGASNTLTRSVTPVLGLTRRGDLKSKLKAFDLGVDDILAVPFSPEELLARSTLPVCLLGGRSRGAERLPRGRGGRAGGVHGGRVPRWHGQRPHPRGRAARGRAWSHRPGGPLTVHGCGPPPCRQPGGEPRAASRPYHPHLAPLRRTGSWWSLRPRPWSAATAARIAGDLVRRR